MKLHISRTKSNTNLYVAQSVREGKKVSCKLIEKLGTVTSIMEARGLQNETEVIEWAKKYIEGINLKKKDEDAELNLTIHPNKTYNLNFDNKVKIGYLILQKTYYTLGLNLICKTIQNKYKITYDINHILESLLYARMITPASNLKTSAEVARYYNWSALEPHQVYRSLSILSKESDYIQSQLFLNSKKVIDRDTSVIYYDCTNFFCEIEQSSGCRQYGVSKEHRPNPIVEFGMFMDSKGYPLGFCVHPGNTSETQTMITLEKKIVKNYSLSEFIVCTDAAMAFSDNKRFNSVGNKHFVTTQPIKKLSKLYQEWALSPDGWRIYIQFYDDDTEEEISKKKKVIANRKLYNLNEIDEDDHYNTIFYKKIGYNQDIQENGVAIKIDQTLYVTFSVKYKRFMRLRRAEQIKKAEEAIKKGNNVSGRDYKRFISKNACTATGEVAEYENLYIDQNVIENEEKFDGFYGVSSDLKDGINKVLSVNKKKWEIEESFRVMKTDFSARPIYLTRDERIEAHLMTCFLTLFLYRFLEKQYLRERYTSSEIIEAIRDFEGVIVGDGIIPAYKYTPCAQAIQVRTNIPLNTEYISRKKLENLSKECKSNSEKIKRLFEPNKKPVGRPSKGTPKDDVQTKKEEEMKK